MSSYSSYSNCNNITKHCTNPAGHKPPGSLSTHACTATTLLPLVWFTWTFRSLVEIVTSAACMLLVWCFMLRNLLTCCCTWANLLAALTLDTTHTRPFKGCCLAMCHNPAWCELAMRSFNCVQTVSICINNCLTATSRMTRTNPLLATHADLAPWHFVWEQHVSSKLYLLWQ